MQDAPQLKEDLAYFLHLMQVETSGVTCFFKELLFIYSFLYECIHMVRVVCTCVCLESPSNPDLPSTGQALQASI